MKNVAVQVFSLKHAVTETRWAAVWTMGINRQPFALLKMANQYVNRTLYFSSRNTQLNVIDADVTGYLYSASS